MWVGDLLGLPNIDRASSISRPTRTQSGFRWSGPSRHFSLSGCVVLSGFALHFFPPRFRAFSADQRPATDLHGGRCPTVFLARKLVVKIFGDAVQTAEFSNRHCKRVRVRTHRLAPVPARRRRGLITPGASDSTPAFLSAVLHYPSHSPHSSHSHARQLYLPQQVRTPLHCAPALSRTSTRRRFDT